MRNIALLLCCLLCVALVSCENPIYMSYQKVSGDTWNKDNEYFFSFNVTDTISTYDLSLEICNILSYPYQNLWFFVSQRQPNGNILRDTFECTLADEFGEWQGLGVYLFQSSVPLKTDFHFPVTGKYTLGIRHGMYANELKGIRELGVCVKRHEYDD